MTNTNDTLQEQRHAAAMQLFEQYDFGAEVAAQNGWEYTTPGTVMTKTVFLDAGLDQASALAEFCVRFADQTSATPIQAGAFLGGGQIGRLRESCEVALSHYRDDFDEPWMNKRKPGM